MSSWAIILQDIEASDAEVADLRLTLLDVCKAKGFAARSVTVQSFIYRENVKPPEPFQLKPVVVYVGHHAKPRRGPGSRGAD